MKTFRFALGVFLSAVCVIRIGGADASVSGTTTVSGTLTLPGGGGPPSYVYSVGQSVTPTGSGYNMPKADYAMLAKVTLASGGTVTKLGIWADFINASTPIKLALFDSSRVVIGSAVSGTITSGDGQWHDIASSITVPSAGTYYIGASNNGAFDGTIVVKVATGASGDSYITFDSGTYTDFPAVTGLTSNDGNFALRLELTP